MITKNYSLAFVLDRDVFLREDLVTANSLYQLDNYIKNNFQDNRDVRKKYDEEISEYALIHRKTIQEENKRNKNNRTGRIVVLENKYDDGKLVNVKELKVIYQNHELLSRKKCIAKIKKTLQDDEKLEELLDRKYYLLSRNEMKLIRNYMKFHYLNYKKEAIGFLCDRIKEMKSSDAYYVRRHLANLCSLVEPVVKLDKGKIKDIGVDNKDYYVNKKSPYVYMDDTNLVDDEDLFYQEEDDDEIMYEQITMDKLLKKEGR